jgi:outer membrane biosynthesis protein TonB
MPTIRQLAVVAALVLGGVAHAGPKQQAKAHIAKATKAHEAGKFELALTELQAAYKLDPQPDLLYAIGQVYSKLGKCDEAEDHFKKFKAATKDPQVKKVVDEAIEACKPADEPKKEEKKEELKKEEPKKEELKKEEPKKEEPKKEEQIKEPDHEEPLVKKEEPKKEEPKKRPFAEAHARHEETHAEGSPFYKDWIGDALVVVGVAAGVVGAIEYNGARADLDSAELANTQDEYRDLVDSAGSKRRNAVIFGAGGSVVIGVGVVHYMLHGRRTETRRVGVVPAKGGGFVTWTGRF